MFDRLVCIAVLTAPGFAERTPLRRMKAAGRRQEMPREPISGGGSTAASLLPTLTPTHPERHCLRIGHFALS